MERSSLQDQWSHYSFDGRTTNQVTLSETAELAKIYGQRQMNELPGAGAPSFKRAGPYMGEREEADWAGNLIAPNRRKGASVQVSARRDNLVIQDGFLMASSESKVEQRLERRQSKDISRDVRFASSAAVQQTCPGGLDASQWKTSTQTLMESSYNDAGRRAPLRSSKRIFTNTSATTSNGILTLNSNQGPVRKQRDPFSEGPATQAFPASKGRPNRDNEDFIKGLDSMALARSLRDAGVKAPEPTPNKLQASDRDRTLLLDNYKRVIPGTTYHQRRHVPI